MSAEPQPEKERPQEGPDTPKRDEVGSQPGKRIPAWLWGLGTLVIAAGGFIATGFFGGLGEGQSPGTPWWSVAIGWLREMLSDLRGAANTVPLLFYIPVLGLGLLAVGFLTALGARIVARIFRGGAQDAKDRRPPGATETSGLFETEPPTLTHQLRDPVPDIVGREEETHILLAALKDRRPAAIVGGGGVGKTQLAYFVGKQLRGEFEAHIGVDMRGLDATPTTPAQAMQRAVLTLAPETKIPDTPGVLEGLYRQILTKQAVLVLADNAADSEQVRALVPNRPSALLITSRQAIQLVEIERVELRDLPPAVSVMLLRKILTGRGLSDEELERLAAVCVHLPLALRVAGDYLAANPAVSVGEYISRIKAKRQQLEFQGRAVMAQLADSVESLERAQAGLVAQWRDLAVFLASFDREAAVAVARFEGDELDTLVGRSLVIYDDDQERFRLHDLMRELAGDGWDEDAAYRARRRHAAHYLAVAGRADEAYLEGGEGVLAGLRLFDQERVQIEAGQAWAAGYAAEDDEAAELAQDYPLRAASVLELRQHPRDRIGWLEASAEAARKLGNRDREGMAVGNLGNGYLELGEPKRAIEYYEQQLPIARETGDRRGEGSALWNRALAFDELGRRPEAISGAKAALEIFEQIEDPNAEKVRRELADWGAAP